SPRSAGDRPATCCTAARGPIPQNPDAPVDARHLSAFHSLWRLTLGWRTVASGEFGRGQSPLLQEAVELRLVCREDGCVETTRRNHLLTWVIGQVPRPRTPVIPRN